MTAQTKGSGMTWVGRAIRRVEDPALVTGQGRFTADLPAVHWVRFLRSPAAAGKIESITTPDGAMVITDADLRDVKPILRSSDKSWNETGHIPKAGEASDTVQQNGDAGEIPGPLDLGFALSRVSPRPGKREQRVVVIGDGDFLSNSFLGNGGNRELGQRVFDWLAGDDDQINVPDKSAPDRTLALSQAALVGMAGFGATPAIRYCPSTTEDVNSD